MRPEFCHSIRRRVHSEELTVTERKTDRRDREKPLDTRQYVSYIFPHPNLPSVPRPDSRLVMHLALLHSTTGDPS